MSVGKFRAKAVEAKLGYASTGTEQVAVAFELLEGHEVGQCVTWYGFFTERAETRTLESLRNAGWRGDDVSDLSSLGSCECVLDIQLEDGRERVKWINAAGSGRVALKLEMTEQQKRAFAARLRGAAAAIPAGARVPAPKREPGDDFPDF